MKIYANLLQWPAVQAPLEEVDQAISTAAWGFVRSFGGIWGVAIPAAIFNARVNSLVGEISDPEARKILLNGGAYALASIGGGTSEQNWGQEIISQVASIYVESLKRCWQVAIGFALLGFAISFVVKDVPLRENLETEFGLEGRRTDDDNNEITKEPKAESRMIPEEVA
jgi:hypothetical protein